MDATRPFVGRQREVEVLLGRLAAASSGSGGVVLVSGPAGIGKTTLVDEAIARYAASAGPLSLGRGVCSDDSGAPPLWPWSRALRAVRGAAGPELTSTLEAGVSTGLTDRADVAAARFQLLTVATDAVLDVPPDRLTVLVLEDLHWADRESLELLRRVAAEVASAPLLVVATHRDVLPAEAVAAIADARRSGAVVAMSLEPLSEAEVGDFLRAVDATEVTLRAPDVHRDTGGLPLLLAAVTDLGDPGHSDLQVIVAGMLNRLSPPEREVVEALSILNPPVEPQLLAEVAEAEPAAVAATVAAGRRAGLLGPPADDGIQFAHALVQDSVRRSADPELRRARHRHAAQVLARRAETAPQLAGEVAAHWRRAGTDRSCAREAARYSRLAAVQAERTLALDDAVRHLRDAEASVRAAGGSDAELAELLVWLATAEFLAGRVAESLNRCEAAAVAAGRAGRHDLLAAAALVVRGVSFPSFGAVERLCRLALAAEQPATVQARLLAQLATAAADASRPDEAAGIAAEALRTAESDGDPGAVLDAVRAREMTLLSPEAGDERVRLGRLAIELAEPLGQSLAAVIGAGWLMRGGYELARMDLVDEASAVMGAAAAASGQPLARWHLVRAAASCAALEGRFGTARTNNLAALELAQRFGEFSAIGMSYAHAVEVATTRGDPSDLLEGSREMLGSAPQMAIIRSSWARLLLMTGEPEPAYALYEGLRAELASMVVDVRWGAVLFHLADLAVSFDDAVTADAVASRMRPWQGVAGAVGVPTAFFLGSPLRHLGLLAATAGRTDEAVTLLREAVERNLAIRARPFVALSRLDLAGVLHRQGALPEAAVLVRQAADELRRLEMPGPLRRADLLSADIAAARRDADPLSTREREVHDLVLHGLSNRDIAARLVLSERTIESHVRSVLAKLGVANRTELLARHARSD